MHFQFYLYVNIYLLAFFNYSLGNLSKGYSFSLIYTPTLVAFHLSDVHPLTHLHTYVIVRHFE